LIAQRPLRNAVLGMDVPNFSRVWARSEACPEGTAGLIEAQGFNPGNRYNYKAVAPLALGHRLLYAKKNNHRVRTSVADGLNG
jgi:hypothetical protein